MFNLISFIFDLAQCRIKLYFVFPSLNGERHILSKVAHALKIFLLFNLSSLPNNDSIEIYQNKNLTVPECVSSF